jgi:L-asparaginase II
MSAPPVLVEVHRGGRVESQHRGHVVIVDASGDVVESWGDPDLVIFPRSSSKMLQALPLVESGAADAVGLGPEQLALACASHTGGAEHTDRVSAWLERLGLSESDLRCGPQVPGDRTARKHMREAHAEPNQIHNNCSGKHTGFLTTATKLGGGSEYIDPDHPVQKAVLAAFEEMTEEVSPGFGIDGCSAPNFACTVTGLARAMAKFTDPGGLGGARGSAVERLYGAMAANPRLIAGEGRACTELGEAMQGRAVVKTGAEGVFVGILKEKKLGVALKIEDGATRASEAVMAALLVRLGLLERDNPAVQARANAEVRNRRDLLTGHVAAVETLLSR